MGKKQDKGKRALPRKTARHTKHHTVPASGQSPAVMTQEDVALRIIRAMAELSPTNESSRHLQIVAFAAGFLCTTSKAFHEAIIELVKNNHVERLPGQMIRLTKEGRAKVVGPVTTTLSTNAGLQARIVHVLRAPNGGKMMKALKDGTAKARIAVVNEMGFSHKDSRGFRDCFRYFKAHGLLEMVKADDGSADTKMQLSDICFPEGRPCVT